MKTYLLASFCLLIFTHAFTQNNVQSVFVPQVGWTINLPANADDFTKDLLNKINKSAQNTKEYPLGEASESDYKGEALSKAYVYHAESEKSGSYIFIEFETLNPAAFINTGWNRVFYNMVDDNSRSVSASSNVNTQQFDTSTSFETIGNSSFAVFRKKTIAKEGSLSSPGFTYVSYYTNRPGNKLLHIVISSPDDERLNDALALLHNSSFTAMSSKVGELPFTSVKRNIEDELKKYAFIPKPATEGKGIKEEDYDKTFGYAPGAFFAGSKKDWLHYLHCCLDQSALAKDKVSGNKSVTVRFILRKDGQPYSLEVKEFPEDCPDCAIEALRLFYKHVQPGASNECKVITTKEPYKQWQPGMVVGRIVSSYVTVVIPFGYDDEPANDRIINDDYKKNAGPLPGAKDDNDASASPAPPDKNDSDDDDDVVAANVARENGKYILTLSKDNSRHTVFRPLAKHTDTAASNQAYAAAGLNKGGWGEITKDKSGKPVVTFYQFDTSGEEGKALINTIPMAYFQMMFYNPK